MANILLQEELSAWIERLADEVLSVYRVTAVGKADEGVPMRGALLAYLVAFSHSEVEARAASLDRLAMLYVRAGLDLSAHFEVSTRLFALLAERAGLRWHDESGRLAAVLVEIQRRLWDDARRITDAFVHARERHLGQLVKQLSVARTELVKVARDDPLTGVRNRGYLLETLSTELERAHRYNEAFSVLFADLDHFKSVNDAHGHEAGDQVLQRVAHLFKRAVRPQDVVGRYGGDEFVVGLVRANASTARRIAERLRSMVEGAHLPDPEASPFVTLSIGVVTIGDLALESIVELLRKADAAMYAAKAAGRNRVRGSPP